MADYPNARTDFSLSTESEYDVVEKYGSVAFKVIDSCYEKHMYSISFDGSSDYGAVIMHEAESKSSKCFYETLKSYPIIPEAERMHIPRDNPPNSLELTPEEVESFDEVPVMSQDEMKSARSTEMFLDEEQLPNDFYEMDTNSPRYKELYKVCKENNSSLPAEEQKSAIDFCISRAM